MLSSFPKQKSKNLKTRCARRRQCFRLGRRFRCKIRVSPRLSTAETSKRFQMPSDDRERKYHRLYYTISYDDVLIRSRPTNHQRRLTATFANATEKEIYTDSRSPTTTYPIITLLATSTSSTTTSHRTKLLKATAIATAGYSDGKENLF